MHCRGFRLSALNACRNYDHDRIHNEIKIESSGILSSIITIVNSYHYGYIETIVIKRILS